MVLKEELVKDATKIRSSGTRTSSLRKRDRRVQIDGGWGWVVTFAAFMVSFILDGIAYSFGLFFTELLEYFGETKSLTAWIISIFNGTYMFIGPIASVLVTSFGYRYVAMSGAVVAFLGFFLCTWSTNVQTMILLYGLLGGFGLGLVHLSAMVTVGHYFERRRALATGIAVCGSGVGGFVFAPISEFLINLYNWKGAMWIISGICLNCAVMGSLLRPFRVSGHHEQNAVPETTKNQNICSAMFDFSLLRKKTFILYAISTFICCLGFHVPFNFLPAYAESSGMTSQESAIIISVSSGCSCISRVVTGWIGDQSWSDTVLINSVALVVGGVASITVTWFGSFWMLIVYSIFIGSSMGIFVSLKTPILADLLGIDKLTASFGLLSMFIGLASFLGSPIAGAIADYAGNYDGSFYFAGASLLLAGITCLPLRKVSEWENSRVDHTAKHGDVNRNIEARMDVGVQCISFKKIQDDSKLDNSE